MRVAIILIALLVIHIAAGQLATNVRTLPVEGAAEPQPARIQYWSYACTEGDTRCDGTRFQKCKTNEWITYDTCSRLEYCNADKGCVSHTAPAEQIRRVTAIPLSREKLALIRSPPVRVSLTCPAMPLKSRTTLPLSPLGDAKTDCELAPKLADISKYMDKLEAMLTDCEAKQKVCWKKIADAKKDLDAQIDQLMLTPPPESGERAQLQTEFKKLTSEICKLTSSTQFSGLELIEGDTDIELQVGGNVLKNLKKLPDKVMKFCAKIGTEPLEPLITACEGINEQLECLNNQGDSEYRKSLHSKIGFSFTTVVGRQNSLEAQGKQVRKAFEMVRKDLSEESLCAPPAKGIAEQLEKIDIALGNKSEYDEQGRLIRKTEVTRDESGRKSTRIFEFMYDWLGRVVKRKETESQQGIDVPTTDINESEYDQFGRVIKVVVVEKNESTGKFTTLTTEFVYDQFGQVIKTVTTTKDESTGITTRITEFAYDEKGRMIKKQEQNASSETPQIRKEPQVFQRIATFFASLFRRE